MATETKELNTYVIEMWHEVMASPLGNSHVRKFISEVIRERAPRLLQEKNIQLIGDYHLDPEHRVIMIVKAPNIEVVRDFLYESGYAAYVDARIYPTTPLAELAAKYATGPTII